MIRYNKNQYKSLYAFSSNKIIDQNDYNIFRAVQTIKEIFLKTLDGQKEEISDFNYTSCKNHIQKAKVDFNHNHMFKAQGLHFLIHYAHIMLITPWGDIDLTSRENNWARYAYSEENESWYVSTEDKDEIANFARKFYKNLFRSSIALTKTNGDSEYEVYAIDLINGVTLPQACYLENSELYKDKNIARRLWQAMEDKYKSETLYLINNS